MEFRPIREFPGYSVSMDGQIRNDDTGRLLALTLNQRGLVQVGLMKKGIQMKRSVALLVAIAYLDPPAIETFDTPIHLDGDRLNNRIDNLMWRPRWFAVKYQQQFAAWRGPSIRQKIIEVGTKMKFKNSWDAARTFGILDQEIKVAVDHNTFVWPTYQRFYILD